MSERRHTLGVVHADPGIETPPRLDADALRRALVEGPDAPYSSLDVVDDIGSTNAELISRAAGGAPDRSVLLAEHQASGRGRLGRVWTAPPRTQVAVSVLLRPGAISPTLFGWLPLVTGLAVRDGLREAGGVDATLKWPNDVLVDGRKIAGILAEMTTVPGGGDFPVRLPAVVVGVGINVSLTGEQLPVPHATSLVLSGGSDDRDSVALAVLEALALRQRQWRECERGSGSTVSDLLMATYTEACSTVGTEVRVELPGGVIRTGRADRVDRDGRLVVVDPDGEFAVAAGDVTHVRGAGGRWGG
ncbi:biotin--[acetyl-CoA-carboxylase] ligase [Dietzia alimentaria]|uniref:biotin--[acetyl-CoA-carboxylase] ligase n=1 Tax=Dietzia sp. SL131 TaxID=2995149 RepID=UPI0008491DB4|nr:biotin--[acetyl-CoA-carboxylase] ligase [Dietzia sp. SL131]MCY1656210.1 biotin--[acetyl-CoA-carboxylase] ligase [Dietzia sp. SL131]ODQ84563.1 biotin--[acetyl-CoA-carboxylase] ligase [Dietzia alimentaria]